MLPFTPSTLLPIFALLLMGGVSANIYFKVIPGSIVEGFDVEAGPQAMCPSGKAVRGFKLKVESDQGSSDDTGLNGIRFFCGPAHKEIHSLESRWGGWGGQTFCPGGDFGVGISMKVEPSGSDDLTGMNNIKMQCAKGAVLLGDGAKWGNWRKMQECDRGHYLCGFQSFVQSVQNDRDDMGMTGLAMACCPNKMMAAHHHH